MGKVENAKDELEAQFGPLAAAAIREAEREKLRPRSAEEMYEEYLRMTDYMTAESGSNEELVLERRALAHHMEDPKEREEFLEYVDDLMRKGRIESLNLENDTKYKTDGRLEVSPDSFIGKDDDVEDPEERDPDVTLDPNQLAHGEWSEWLITVDRNTKLWRGGRLESYRALVIGGNLNGCGGFGVGKASDPILAVDIAGRRCKRNIFFVDRYQGNGLTRDLVGKQNSCKVTLRATDTGLRGNELATEILKRFGITNCVAKAYGNRNVYNVVRATFKALLTHESLEEIALKRGKRLVSVDRAMRLKI